MPPMEAMACGLPVVTTNAGAIPEYALPGKTALVSLPGDTKEMVQNVVRFIEDKKLRKNIAKAGRQYVQKFRWQNAAKELEKVFKKYL